MADDAISSAELKSLVTVQILASDGSTVVKTIFTIFFILNLFINI